MIMLERPSPNQDSRGGTAIDMLVLHYTGMLTGESALARLCDPQARVSAHYTIDEDGTVYAMVPEAYRAWHAGVSFWAGARDINARSIGIELVNPGHEFGYRAFTEPQIAALIELCREILARHAIPPWRVLGHSDVAPDRKDDPGELFPWKRLAEAGIGIWPAEGDDPGEGAVAALLARLGYDPEAPLEKTVTAFQRHFRPSRVDGMAGDETRRLLSGLARLYDAGKEGRA
jgi:N-acetylmuramoyl-L-alanine amidase